MSRNEEMNNRSLPETLAVWEVTPTCNPQFRAEVWSRIEQARNAERLSFGRWLLGQGRSLLTAGVACVALAVGTAALVAHVRNTRVREAGVAAYLQTIDPHLRVQPEPTS